MTHARRPAGWMATICLLALAAAWGCSSRKEDNPGEEPRYELKQKFAPGLYTGDVTQNITQTVKADGRTQNVPQKMTMSLRLNIENPAADGTRKATVRYDHFRMTLPDGKSLDSKDSPPSRTSSARPVYEMLKGLTEVPLTIHIGADDTIQRVEGMDAMWARAGRSAGPQARGMLEQFKQSFGDSALRELMGTKYLPDHAVGKGAVWHPKVEMNMPALGRTSIEFECELLEYIPRGEHRIAKIAFTAEITSEDAKDMTIGPATMKFTDLEMDLSGTFQFDTGLGMVVRQDMELSGEFEMEVSVPGQEAQEVSSKMEGTMTVAVRKTGEATKAP